MKSKIQNVKPLILSISLMILICIFAAVREQNQNLWEHSAVSFDILVVGVYLAWIGFESRISFKEKKKGSKTSDRGTLEFYAVSQALTILSALWFEPVWQSPGLVHLFGVMVFLSGLWLRRWAVSTLGHYYSHLVREVEGHKIVDSGPYRYIRHPAYAGMIVAHLGIVLFFFNPVTVSIFLFALVPAILVRIVVEERTLFGMEGYIEYALHRKRLVPGIW